MPRQSSFIKNEQIAFRATNDFKQTLRQWAESVKATDGEFCREAVKELGKAISSDPAAREHLRARFAA